MEVSLKILLLFLITFFSFRSFTKNLNPDVIYGIDDRLEFYESPDEYMRKMSHSVAAKIMDSNFIDVGDGTYKLINKTLADKNICQEEKFVHDPTNANCSSFLIGPDLLATAGHCVLTEDQCQNHQWVFDYLYTSENHNEFVFNNEQMYRC
jgi:hypothetical protein